MPSFLFDRTDRAKAPWRFELFTDGSTPFGTIALTNLRVLCETYLPERFEIEMIDAGKDPRRARAAGIGALPCIVRRHPAPIVRTLVCRNLRRLGQDLGLRSPKVRASA